MAHASSESEVILVSHHQGSPAQNPNKAQMSAFDHGKRHLPEENAMPIATDTAEFLEELNGGAFASQIGHALSEVASGVVDHGKAGKLVITLDFSQIGESSQVKIKHKLDYKVPTKRGTRSENTSLDTPMHVGSGGKITLFAEKHDQLFSREQAPITPRT